MPPVLILREPELPFEPRRLTELLATRIDGVRTELLYPHRLLPVAREMLTRQPGRRVIHAVGGRALALAVLAGDASVLYTATRFPTTRDIGWLRAAMKYRDVKIVVGSDAERRAWVSGGVPMDRCRLVRPGVSLAAPVAEREAARAHFGFASDERVVFAPLAVVGPERTTPVWTGCLLNILDPNFKILAWADGDASAIERLASLRTRLVDPAACRICPDAEPAAALAACDLIVLPPAEFVAPTLIAMAMASGKPIVAHASAQICELLEDRHTALLTGGRSPNEMADRATDVVNDPSLARQVADRARAEVYEHFLVSRLLNDFRTLYAGASAMALPQADVTAPPAVATP